MAIIFRHILFFCIVASLFLSSSAQSCKNYTFTGNKVFSSCTDLPVLNSFLHWNYTSSSGIVQIAYRNTEVTSFTWIAWAINPMGIGMLGSQALVAYQGTNGNMVVYTSSVTSYATELQPGNLSFVVSNISAEFANNEMIIFATLELPNNSTTVNQVWQVGPLSGNTPAMHPPSGANLRSMSTLNFLAEKTARTTTEGRNSRRRRNYYFLN